MYRAGEVFVHRTCCARATQPYSLGGGGSSYPGSRPADVTTRKFENSNRVFTRSLDVNYSQTDNSQRNRAIITHAENRTSLSADFLLFGLCNKKITSGPVIFHTVIDACTDKEIHLNKIDGNIIIIIITSLFQEDNHIWHEWQSNIWSSVTKTYKRLIITKQWKLFTVQSRWGLRTSNMLRACYPTLLAWRGRFDLSRLKTSRCYHT